MQAPKMSAYCFINQETEQSCQNPAIFEVYGQSGRPDDNTLCCAAHVDEMKNDGDSVFVFEQSARSECGVPPDGWRCTRKLGHSGPCAAVPFQG